MMEEKQRYLQEEIIQGGHDPTVFTEYFNEKTGHGDLEEVSLEDLSDIVKAFKSGKSDRSSESDDPYNEVQVFIKDAVKKEGGLFSSEQTEYILLTLPFNWEVIRKYDDFKWMRELLVHSFPGVYVPPIPSKGHAKCDKFLNLFVKAISRNSNLLKSQVFLAFIKEENLKESRKKWKKMKSIEIAPESGDIEFALKYANYTDTVENIHKNLRNEVNGIYRNLQNLSNSLNEFAGTVGGLVKTQKSINSDQGVQFYSILYQTFNEWSKHELETKQIINEFYEEHFTYSDMELDTLKKLAKPLYKKKELQMAQFIAAKLPQETEKLSVDSFVQSSHNFERMTNRMIEHCRQLNQIWDALQHSLEYIL